MVNILLEEINYRQYQDYQFEYSDAEKILGELEKAGMQPPENKKLQEENCELWSYNI